MLLSSSSYLAAYSGSSVGSRTYMSTGSTMLNTFASVGQTDLWDCNGCHLHETHVLMTSKGALLSRAAKAGAQMVEALCWFEPQADNEQERRLYNKECGPLRTFLNRASARLCPPGASTRCAAALFMDADWIIDRHRKCREMDEGEYIEIQVTWKTWQISFHTILQVIFLRR